jgi:hypothetical protein
VRTGQPIRVVIGVDRDAAHMGGVDLFGRGFGNYPQDLVLAIDYVPREGSRDAATRRADRADRASVGTSRSDAAGEVAVRLRPAQLPGELARVRPGIDGEELDVEHLGEVLDDVESDRL